MQKLIAVYVLKIVPFDFRNFEVTSPDNLRVSFGVVYFPKEEDFSQLRYVRSIHNHPSKFAIHFLIMQSVYCD